MTAHVGGSSGPRTNERKRVLWGSLKNYVSVAVPEGPSLQEVGKSNSAASFAPSFFACLSPQPNPPAGPCQKRRQSDAPAAKEERNLDNLLPSPFTAPFLARATKTSEGCPPAARGGPNNTFLLPWASEPEGPDPTRTPFTSQRLNVEGSIWSVLCRVYRHQKAWRQSASF